VLAFNILSALILDRIIGRTLPMKNGNNILQDKSLDKQANIWPWRRIRRWMLKLATLRKGSENIDGLFPSC
jgi:hypothetical protein